ncbi:MAG: isocitrate/isopropylmalate dehydrogenase family protein [Betaproteobacteria bacterium]|nr:isocitrate/isopropylmalate dehydrogenase family protein [Betaproteobacteria bacterium]MDH3435684.1 isocitrate/isopropylmalate dehydrogenase family protein [Betaproteobacteria bacterium]
MYKIAVLPGDGIGVEVMAAAKEVLTAVCNQVGSVRLAFTDYPAGATAYQETGTALSDETIRACEQADAILLGAMGLPHIRYKDGTEISPQLDLREHLELYAGVRPIRPLKGLSPRLADPRAAKIDFVLVREQTEGLFSERGKTQVKDDAEARDALVITRKRSERVFDFAFRLAQRRRERGRAGRVTCVDKANVLGSMAFFRRIFEERTKRFAGIMADSAYVDAMALNLVMKPWDYDVLVTENMFGDILSDLSAALVGGMGMAPSGDIGDQHALFQPAHGSAPDIAGTGHANPTAMLLSAAMMLEWLGDRNGDAAAHEAAGRLDSAVERAFAGGRVVPYEFGGTSGTADITRAVVASLTTGGATSGSPSKW